LFAPVTVPATKKLPRPVYCTGVDRVSMLRFPEKYTFPVTVSCEVPEELYV
jgi:hypothetical protein